MKSRDGEDEGALTFPLLGYGGLETNINTRRKDRIERACLLVKCERGGDPIEVTGILFDKISSKLEQSQPEILPT